jgi:hypothetical protein
MVTKVPWQESVMKAKQAEFRTILRAAVPLVTGLALSSYATTSFALGTAEQRIACTPDVFRLCSSEIPNVDSIIACMMAKKASLSPACRVAIDTAMSKKTASSE